MLLQDVPTILIGKVCGICGKEGNEHLLLLCDGCDGAIHTYCCTPPLAHAPQGCVPHCCLLNHLQVISTANPAAIYAARMRLQSNKSCWQELALQGKILVPPHARETNVARALHECAKNSLPV